MAFAVKKYILSQFATTQPNKTVQCAAWFCDRFSERMHQIQIRPFKRHFSYLNITFIESESKLYVILIDSNEGCRLIDFTFGEFD